MFIRLVQKKGTSLDTLITTIQERLHDRHERVISTYIPTHILVFSNVILYAESSSIRLFALQHIRSSATAFQ